VEVVQRRLVLQQNDSTEDSTEMRKMQQQLESKEEEIALYSYELFIL
jgi:hypothetical protein